MSTSTSMSSMPYASSSTISLPTVYPTPPPTTNTLGHAQRTRLLKSTRKLEAVLGTTPFLLEPATAPPSLPLPPPPASYSSEPEPPTPRTKRSRRTGRIFTPNSADSIAQSASASSSTTSLSSYSSESEEGYVVVPKGGGATGYHYHHLDLDISLPKNHRKEPIKVSLVPSTTSDLPPQPKGKKAKGPKALPPPLLLRLRAVPVPAGDSRAVRDSVISTTSGAAPAKSPLSPTFLNTSTATSGTPKDKRKKLAKLSRTFGEPVPPELVFPSSACVSARDAKEVNAKKPVGPRPSDRERRREKREGKRRAVDPLPPTPPASSSLQGAQGAQKNLPVPVSRRPRSLTLPPLPSLPPLPLHVPAPIYSSSSEGEDEGEDTPPTSASSSTHDLPASLKVLLQPPPAPVASPKTHKPSASFPTRPRTASSGNSRTSEAKTHHVIGASGHTRAWTVDAGAQEGQGYRREREWSGEWNVCMDDVVRRLRELKAR